MSRSPKSETLLARVRYSNGCTHLVVAPVDRNQFGCTASHPTEDFVTPLQERLRVCNPSLPLKTAAIKTEVGRRQLLRRAKLTSIVSDIARPHWVDGFALVSSQRGIKDVAAEAQIDRDFGIGNNLRRVLFQKEGNRLRGVLGCTRIVVNGASPDIAGRLQIGEESRFFFRQLSESHHRSQALTSPRNYDPQLFDGDPSRLPMLTMVQKYASGRPLAQFAVTVGSGRRPLSDFDSATGRLLGLFAAATAAASSISMSSPARTRRAELNTTIRPEAT